MLRVCGCGFACDDDTWMDGHLWQRPAHEERDLSRYLVRASLRTP
jgi:hypothetical protein